MVIEVTIEGKVCRIRNEGTQFIPEFTSRNMGNKGDKDKEVTRDIGFFSSLGNAVHRLITEVLASDESTITLEHYVQRYQAAVKEVQGILTNKQKAEEKVIEESNELDEF